VAEEKVLTKQNLVSVFERRNIRLSIFTFFIFYSRRDSHLTQRQKNNKINFLLPTTPWHIPNA